jgi:hypothetical protein
MLMADIIQWRRDTAADWTSVNPTLADGEAGYETDTSKLKIGDGLTVWTSLPYFASVALPIDATDIADGSVTNTEFQYINTLSSNAQTQLDNKQPLDSTLTALAAYNTNGLLTQTAPDTFTGRTATGTTNRLSVTNGDGVSGNPTFDISSSYVGQSSITTLGTITTGTWNGSVLGSAYGGTGFSTYAAGDLIYASAVNTLSKLAVGTDGYVLTLVAGLPAWTAVSGTGTVTSVNLTAGTGISVSGGPITTSGSITVNNTDTGSAQNIFKNFAVSGQSTVVADSNNDTLTLVAGSNVTITTDSATDSITINSTGGGGGGGATSNKLTADLTIAADTSYIVMSVFDVNGFTLTLNGYLGIL